MAVQRHRSANPLASRVDVEAKVLLCRCGAEHLHKYNLSSHWVPEHLHHLKHLISSLHGYNAAAEKARLSMAIVSRKAKECATPSARLVSSGPAAVESYRRSIDLLDLYCCSSILSSQESDTRWNYLCYEDQRPSPTSLFSVPLSTNNHHCDFQHFHYLYRSRCEAL
jgi:hypothetical protein